MALSLEEVRRTAALSRLRLTPAEEELYAGQLGRIVAHIDHLREFETSTEEPDPPAGGEAADEPQPDPRGELFLENAPEVRGPFFAVPRMQAGGVGAADTDPVDV
ncbi:MAG: Asp-tRNA(Asn)/Glu-tRNA(Gln) amidotransferase subunit GatC [Thermoanaerobaculia bacterium]